MATASCAHCTSCSVDMAYTPPDFSTFELLVLECEERYQQRLQDSEKQTCARDEASIIKWLLVNASDIEFHPLDLESIVQQCRNFEHQQLLAFLHHHHVFINRDDKDNFEKRNRNALICAARHGDPEIITWLMEHVSGAIDHRPIITSAFLGAAEHGKLNNMERLLGYESSGIDNKYKRIAMLTTSKDYVDIIKQLYQNESRACLKAFNTVLEKQYYHIVQWFIDTGINVNYLDYNDTNCMYYALKHGRIEVIQWLMTHLDTVDGQGNSFVYIAAKYGHLHIITWLIDQGFSITETNTDGVTPLQIAAKEGYVDCVKYLVHIGANVLDTSKDIKSKSVLHFACESENVDIVKFLVEHGADIDVLDFDKNSVIHNAAECLDIVKYLVELGCNVRSENRKKETVLSLAVKASLFQVVDWLLNETSLNITDVILVMYSQIFMDAHVNKLQFMKFLLDLLPSWDINGKHDRNETLLHKCVCYIKAVTLLLDHGADVNALDRFGNTALHTALSVGMWEVADLLLQRGADVHIKNKKLETVLYHAINKRDKCNIALLQRIVELGVEVNARTLQGDTVLHRAIQYENLPYVRYLASIGADINAKDSENKSVVEKAAYQNEWGIVKYLMTEACATVDMEQFNYILYHALSCQNVDLVEWLVKRCPDVANINVAIENSPSVLHRCMYSKDDDVQLNMIKLCLNYGADVNALDRDNTTILHKLVTTNHDIVKLLLENGADANLTDSEGNTPMHEVLQDGRNIYIENLLNNKCIKSDILSTNLRKLTSDTEKYRIVQMLLQHGASTNIKNAKGQTCLHLAAMHGNTQDIARMLLDHGADVHAIDNEGNTVLHTMHFDHLTTCLIENNVDLLNVRNSNGEIVLHKAVSLLDYHHSTDSVSALKFLHDRSLQLKQHPHVKQAMLKDVAHERYVRSLRCIISHTSNINESDNDGLIPLHHAAKNGNVSAFKCLMQCNADLNIVTIDLDTVLHIAASKGKLGILKFFLSLKQDSKLFNARNICLETVLFSAVISHNKEIIRLILEQDVDVNARNILNMTALHTAVHEGQLDIVEMLVSKETDMLIRDNYRMTPIHYAVSQYEIDILKFLVATLKAKHPNNYKEIVLNLKTENHELLMQVAFSSIPYE